MIIGEGPGANEDKEDCLLLEELDSYLTKCCYQ